LPDESLDMGSDNLAGIRGQLHVGGERFRIVACLAALRRHEKVWPALQALPICRSKSDPPAWARRTVQVAVVSWATADQ
jgi:hypothetical protein